jgi:AcrR family transcriptional regulator
VSATAKPLGRRAGESGTREAILRAARERFAAHGYDAATIRAIAADADVDPALVHHFYGTKERLFVEALRFPAVPSELLSRVTSARRSGLGEAIVRTVLDVWSSEATRAQALALIRSAITNERAARMLREFVTGTILSVLATAAADEDAELRASLVASQIIGLAIARYAVAVEPLASASDDEVVARVAPTLQRYLTGSLPPR